MALRIFISHSTEDRAAYTLLCSLLDGRGLSRWDQASMRVGGYLAEQLKRAIAACDACIFLATPRSLESRWCYAELGAFWGAGKKVLIYVADASVKPEDLPPQFQGYLWTADAGRLLEELGKLTTEQEDSSIPPRAVSAVTALRPLATELEGNLRRLTRFADDGFTVSGSHKDFSVSSKAGKHVHLDYVVCQVTVFEDPSVQDAISQVSSDLRTNLLDVYAALSDINSAAAEIQSAWRKGRVERYLNTVERFERDMRSIATECLEKIQRQDGGAS